MDNRLLDEHSIIQLCFVTEDLNKTAEWLSELTGVAAGPVRPFAPDESAIYKGSRGHRFGCQIRFMDFGNIELEIIQPDKSPSAWRDLLNEKGPGFHHFAIKTRNLTKRKAYLESKGHELLQQGEFDNGGGRYAYFNTMSDLGALLELLEFDNDKEPQPQG